MDSIAFLTPLFEPKILMTIAAGTFGGLVIGALPGLTAFLTGAAYNEVTMVKKKPQEDEDD